MNVLHVITGLPKAAGTSVFCCEVANGIADIGHNVTVAIVDLACNDMCLLSPRVELMSIKSLLKGASQFHVCHIHGMWTPILHRVSKWADRNGVPVVWSLHGMLTRWSFNFKWWKKIPAWWLYQKADLKRAHMIHVTAEHEISYARHLGLKNSMAIIPLGVKMPGFRPAQPKGTVKQISYIGRVSRVKGLENLCRAVSAANINKDWRVAIIGPDNEGYVAKLRHLVLDLDIAGHIDFQGPKYGGALSDAYVNTDILVLPSYSENFGSVVIEALAYGIPVIATKGTPWKELEDWHCGWWVDMGVTPLRDALCQAMSLSDAERREMGERGRQLIREKYTWPSIVRKMLGEYMAVV